MNISDTSSFSRNPGQTQNPHTNHVLESIKLESINFSGNQKKQSSKESERNLQPRKNISLVSDSSQTPDFANGFSPTIGSI